MTVCVWYLPPYLSSKNFTVRAVPTGMAWSVCASSTRSYQTLMRYEEKDTILQLSLPDSLSFCFCVSPSPPHYHVSVMQLLSKPKFSSVEKIKTIGSTYMAAAGLTQSPLGDESKVLLAPHEWLCFHPFLKTNLHHVLKACPILFPAWHWHDLWLPLQKVEMSYTHVRCMVEFAIALMGKLELINTHSFNSFKLRIGEFQNAKSQMSKPCVFFLCLHSCNLSSKKRMLCF